jgi:predicted nucleic acid-binding protein
LSFVDTNLLIDVATNNPAWAHWSRQTLVATRARGLLLINAIVYAEFAMPFDAQADCDAEIEKFDLRMVEIPASAAFRAAQAFRLYRRSCKLSGRASFDARRPPLSRIFPELALIAPEGS